MFQINIDMSGAWSVWAPGVLNFPIKKECPENVRLLENVRKIAIFRTLSGHLTRTLMSGILQFSGHFLDRSTFSGRFR